MKYKILTFLIVFVIFVFDTVMEYLQIKSSEREIPDNVKDVYDKEEYEKWLSYHKEGCKLSFIRHIVSFFVLALILGFDIYAKLLHLTDLTNVYLVAIFVTIIDILISMIWSVPFSYKNTMGIEQKYGFNRMTKKTFVADTIKSFIINALFMSGLVCLFILIHQALGDWLLVVFTGIMLLVVLVIIFISPLTVRIYNKLEPLPEGELRDKLTALLECNDCTVKDIKVSDGSKRSSKANAFFAGFGKSKTIVLFDTLLEQMTEEEIVAVFAHEMGHNKHKDTLKMYGVTIVNVFAIAVGAWALVSVPEICMAFGFESVEYGFAFILLGNVFLAFLSPLINLFASVLSRKHEYAADAFAVDNGYGEALITALKKLAKNSFSCLSPHPFLVKMTYSHPTISQRVEAMEKRMRNK